MNIIKLLQLVKEQVDFNTFTAIFEDFMEDYREEYKKLKPCKSTMEKAIKKYIAGATIKDSSKTGTYSEGHTVLMLNSDIPEAEPENMRSIDIATDIMNRIKTRRPVDCYFFDSVALYKALKRQEKGKYLLHIDGHYYDARFISDLLECIADKKERYVSAEICENGELFIRQKHAAMILPVAVNSCHPSLNINMQDFLKATDSIEKEYLEEIRKSA